jgi:Rrf2 family iron-sulfur cluster assembly transcriptional regulator
VADVITAVDESVDATRCGGMSNCHNDQRCLTHDLWTDLSDQIRTFLSEITLGHLMERGGVREVADRQNRAAQKEDIVEVPVAFNVARA